MNWIGTDYQLMKQAINHSVMNQKVISHNLSNIDTPNFKAKQAVFEQTLSNEMRLKLAGGRPSDRGGATKIVDRAGGAMRSDGNSVDLDYEMSELARNQLQYEAMMEQLNRRLGGLKTVIRGGR
ncbi:MULTISPECIES: flagellar basal body rod protein FlgB [unclassified Exiguobacterium]|uniref:flagellar basal body rod protein FlgB n=1 Tax=unclassified Exiguobacterium TaxID=2644629 RepID=UPI00103ABFEA|nr:MULTISPECIES: flagellar basal body rod protein FlgB [unclassified Exiguobacterium]TCI37736.1 flagellar basal body rod protein FlgB [Exiguobacterium sp. SH4S7]TCI45487.1 flagellar basal body rod protein FlgB [Exiguobacterium sp. SH5S32]TCI52688.1 flagellar basal body rod protein FlgB [Exiguobacterium sp. SH1S4]TCI65459.1 flagellar basal body rod protein FlgB [Exiguobacterium sp. SH0S2]TCI70877.1 flagellar basal body rod protein FlgB [Exiguobacterium sp. SH1S1]